MGRNLDSEDLGISLSQQHTARTLMTPDEVRNLPKEVELLFSPGNAQSLPPSSPIMPTQNS